MSIIEQPGVDHTDDDPQVPTDRRALFAKGAAVAAAAAVAGIALGKPASAANGGNFIIGQSNTGTATTGLTGGSTLQVTNGGSAGRNATVLGGDKRASVYATQGTSNRVGVLGEATGTSGGWGVLGFNNSSQGRGVVGVTVGGSGIAVYGEHADTSTSGTGVVGVSRLGTGVVANGTVNDIAAMGSGRVILSAAGAPGAPTGAGSLGTIARDAAGNLWYAVANNSWRKLTGTATAGAFHPITPTRVYDSRWTGEAGKILADQNRVVSVANGRNLNTGAVTVNNLVPAGATAVVGNLTLSNSNAGFGALALTPGDAATFTASTINWEGADVVLANGFTLKLDASRQIKVFCLGTGTNFIVDIVGYYL
jgi:hypothetical protein